MAVVYDRHKEEMKPLHNHLIANNMNFIQFIRTYNFILDMNDDDIKKYIDAYENGEFEKHGWY